MGAYLGVLLGKFGIALPEFLAYGASPFSETKGFDLMAILLIIALGVLITVGIKESLRVNMVLVGVKLFIVLFVIVAGLMFVNPANYTPFIPDSVPSAASEGFSWTQPLIQWLTGAAPAAFGWSGVFAGAALVFFAYIGFDVVATTAEETRNPQRDLPIGIIASLIICTVLYLRGRAGCRRHGQLRRHRPQRGAGERVRPSRAGLDGHPR